MTRLAGVRAAEKRCGVTVGVLLDLPGPKLRLGTVASGTLLVRRRDASCCTPVSARETLQGHA